MSRIALVAHRYPPAIGGVEQHVAQLAQGLAARGLEVEVITTDPSGQLAPLEESAGVLVRRFPTLGRNTVYYLSPWLGLWLARNAGRFDILHAHSYHTPLAFQTLAAARRAGKPYFLTAHYHGTGHSPLRRALHVPYRPIGGLVLNGARRVVCVSEAERAMLHRHFGPQLRTVVVPNGVDVARIQATVPYERAPDRTLLLMVGRLEPYKQTARVIAALQLLPGQYELVIIGDGPARSELELYTQQLGLSERVRMLGYLPQPELDRWLRSADLFISLSLREAFGIAVLEGAVGGAGVIASSIPAHSEVAGYLPPGHISLIEPDCTPAALAVRIAEIAAARRRSAADASGRAADFARVPTWDDVVSSTLACYKDSLGSESVSRSTRPLKVA